MPNEPKQGKPSVEKQLDEETDESEEKTEIKITIVEQLNKIEKIDLSEKTDRENIETENIENLEKENVKNSEQISTEAIVEKNISE